MICPRCNQNQLDPILIKNALSRKDNKTYICNECGIDEALEDSLKEEFSILKHEFFKTFKTSHIKG